jgi:hypothetical protein
MDQTQIAYSGAIAICPFAALAPSKHAVPSNRRKHPPEVAGLSWRAKVIVPPAGITP